MANLTDSVQLDGGFVQDLQKRNRFLEDTRRAIFNVLEDMSESEGELKQKTDELDKFRRAVDSSFDHVIISDLNGKILYANHAAELLTGFTKEEMIGQTPALWGKQMPPEFYETFWRTIKIEKSPYAGELTNCRKDGTKYLTTLRVSPILDDHGDISFFVGVERDITEERQSQLRIVRHTAELEQANVHIEEEKNRAKNVLRFLKSIGEGVFATDEMQHIVFMNETAELMAGKVLSESDQALPEDIFQFVHKGHVGSTEVKIVATALEKKRTTTFPDKTFILRKGKEIPVSGTCSLIRDEKQNVIGTITVFQDITKKHELDQLKDSFLSVAAHQLRTPLGSMRWSMELLLNGDLGRIPKGAKDLDAAQKFIAYSIQPQQQKTYSENIAYGPANTKAVALMDKSMLADMPTTPENIANQVPMDVVFWADYGEQLEQRFNAWAAK